MSFLYSPLLVSSHFVCFVFIWSLLLLLLILSQFFSYKRYFVSHPIFLSFLFLSHLLSLDLGLFLPSFFFLISSLLSDLLFSFLASLCLSSLHCHLVTSFWSHLFLCLISHLSFFLSSFLFFLILLCFILSRFISSQVSFTRKERSKKERERTSVNSSRLSNDNISEAYKPHTTELCCPSLSVSSKDKVVHEELEALQKPAFVSVCAHTYVDVFDVPVGWM